MSFNLTKTNAQEIATLMAQTNQIEFRQNLMMFVRSFMVCNSFLLLTYEGNQLPIAHFTWIEDRRLAKIYQAQYLTGAYRLDPYYQLSLRPFRDGQYRLKSIAPDRFFASEYYKQYYSQTGLGDELCIAVRRSDGAATHISISRGIKHGLYTRSELKSWKTLEPILVTLLSATPRRRWQMEALKRIKKKRPNRLIPQNLFAVLHNGTLKHR